MPEHATAHGAEVSCTQGSPAQQYQPLLVRPTTHGENLPGVAPFRSVFRGKKPKTPARKPLPKSQTTPPPSTPPVPQPRAPIVSLLDVDDEEAFLLAVEAAEAAAIASSKRHRLSTSPSPTPAASEGSYLSALKGSHSSAWKQQQETLTHAHKRPGGSRAPATTPAGGVGGSQIARGACFKCGDTSHWARDCHQSVPASGGGGGGGGIGGSGGSGGGGYVDASGEVEEKACPCGAGICLVLTSNTPRNPGRRFYRCPMRDNGGCNFFEWCDAPSPDPANARSNSVFQSDTCR